VVWFIRIASLASLLGALPETDQRGPPVFQMLGQLSSSNFIGDLSGQPCDKKYV
jgi:hypothetical protein